MTKTGLFTDFTTALNLRPLRPLILTVKGSLAEEPNISTFDDLRANTGLYGLKQASVFLFSTH